MIDPCSQVIAYWCARCVYATQNCAVLAIGKQAQYSGGVLPGEWYQDAHDLWRCRTYFRQEDVER